MFIKILVEYIACSSVSIFVFSKLVEVIYKD